MKQIKVLVVDDSSLIRRIFSDMLSSDPEILVIDTAVDPLDARDKIKSLNPDVITLDIEMPKMDGISFLEKIMTLRPMPVVMASTLTQKGATATLRALELGAVDYVAKPTDGGNPQTLSLLKEELITKVKMAAKANVSRVTRSANADKKPKVCNFTPAAAYKPIIAIGSSTGGVEALRDIFLALPANCPPIVMTQHMPEQFTKSFADRLNSLSAVTVSEAVGGEQLKQGFAYLAPGNKHMKVVKKGSEYFCQLEEGPRVSGHCPSVDVLFESVAQTIGNRAVGVILTGMGKDGAEGMLKMHEAGAYTIGQNQSSCVVYGMPRAAFLLGSVDIELSLSDIPAHLLKSCESKRTGRDGA